MFNLAAPDWFALLAVGLATWRVSSLLVWERGPWAVFTRLRARAGVTHDDAGEPVAWPAQGVGLALACVWCVSLWVAPAVWLLWLLWAPLILTLAASALAIVVQSMVSRNR